MQAAKEPVQILVPGKRDSSSGLHAWEHSANHQQMHLPKTHNASVTRDLRSELEQINLHTTPNIYSLTDNFQTPENLLHSLRPSEQKAVVYKALKVCGLCFCRSCLGVWEKRLIYKLFLSNSVNAEVSFIMKYWFPHSANCPFSFSLHVLLCASRGAHEFAHCFQQLTW